MPSYFPSFTVALYMPLLPLPRAVFRHRVPLTPVVVKFDFKKVQLHSLVSKERIIELRGAITREVFLHDAIGKYITRLVGATRPYDAETEWPYRSPSELVETCVDLGASPRATICWGRLVKVWAVLQHGRDEVYPEDVQELAAIHPATATTTSTKSMSSRVPPASNTMASFTISNPVMLFSFNPM